MPMTALVAPLAAGNAPLSERRRLVIDYLAADECELAIVLINVNVYDSRLPSSSAS